MVQWNWVLLALVGAVFIYEASGFDCVQCNSEDPKCIDGSIAASACTDGDKCFVRSTIDKIERGCLPQNEESTCDLEDGTSCKMCSTEGCNAFEWPRCHQCTTLEENCSEEKSGTGSFCGVYKTGDKCFERFVKGKVERGCESDVTLTDDVCANDAECKSCSGDGCNTEAGREFQVTTCVQCDTSNDADGTCLDGTKAATACAAASDKKCYSKILDDGSLKQGCYSELSANEVTACTGTKCDICDGDECNKRIFPANRLGCYQCNKATDADCANDLTGDAKAGICKKYVEGDKCYLRVLEDLTFERGCQSDLAIAQQGCPDLPNCFECEGKNCNSLSEQKLKDSTKCQRCNSDSANCLDGSAPAQSCGQENDVCFVRINSDGKLERNCLSTLTDDADKLKCNTESDNTCVACSAGESCNNQKWLQCHQCTGTDCAVEQTGAPSFCGNYREENQCYERFVDGKEVQRGCESDLTPETVNVCEANQQCKTCKEDGCNKDVSTAFLATNCVQCKSDDVADGSSCLAGTKEATNCDNPDGKCFSRIIEGGILERGCGSVLSDTEQTSCTGSLCQLCSAADCNKPVFPVGRLGCYQCEKTADADCANELTGDAKAGICQKYVEDDKCYSRVLEDSTFERGCQSDKDENVCNGLTDCLECSNSNCNGLSEDKLKSWSKCLQCDTDDDACVNATVSASTCSEEGDSCYVRINNGKLERNCLATLEAADKAKCNDETDLSCVSCTGSGCNVQKWMKCHQCKESTSAACKEAQEDYASASYCPNYKENDECYERLESELVVRGCASDLSQAACLNSLECKTCGDNACNNKAAADLKTDQRCLQCSTNSDAGGLCLAGTTATQPCKTESESKCFMQVQSDGHLKRGCKGDLSEAEVTACSGDTCRICNEPSCNTGIYPANRLRCYQCKSSVDKTCNETLQGEDKSLYCKLYKADDKCYSRDASDDLFERGCQSDLGLTADACQDLDDKHCESCSGENCNVVSKEKLNGAGALATNMALLTIALVALGAFFNVPL